MYYNNVAKKAKGDAALIFGQVIHTEPRKVNQVNNYFFRTDRLAEIPEVQII